MFAYLLGLIAGLAQPTQTSINTKLGDKVKSPYISTVISFATACVVLLIIDMIVEGGVSIPFSEVAKYPLWIWTGGLCGVGIVLLSIVSLPHIGSASVVIMTSFGQVMTSVVIDQFGLYGSPQIRMTGMRAIGALMVVAGVVIASIEKTSDNGAEKTGNKVLYYAVTFFVGFLCATQIGVNGTLGGVVGSPWFGATLSMSIGLAGTLLLTGIIFLTKGRSGIFSEKEDTPFRWYMLIGGSMGVIIVGTNAITAPIIGTGMVSIMNLVGFMIGGLLIDAVGFLGIEKKPVTLVKIVGIVLMIVGTIVITLM